MSKFKVGDRVTSTGMYAVGDNGTVMLDDGSRMLYHVKFDKLKLTLWMYENNLRKENTMSKYQEMKERIEALDNGWDKDADDIRREIGIAFHFILDEDATSGYGHIEMSRRGYTQTNKHFTFTSQCSKMTAFKKALMWLLDNSSIKKDDKRKEKEEIQKEIDKLQDRLNNLEG